MFGHLQDLGAHALDVVAQLAMAEAVGGEGVDVAVDVAELVVEERALHPLREVALNVAETFADLIERGLDLGGLRRVAELHEHRRIARRGVAAHVVQGRDLLQFLLDAIGDLLRVSPMVAPGHTACTTIVLIAKGGSSSRPSPR